MTKMISDKVVEQILAIRKDGKFNMFDINNIQVEVYNKDFYELVCFLEEHKEEYLEFILTGNR